MNSWPDILLVWSGRARILSPGADVRPLKPGRGQAGAGFTVLVLTLAAALLLVPARGISGKCTQIPHLSRFWSAYAGNRKAAAHAHGRGHLWTDAGTRRRGGPGMERRADAFGPGRSRGGSPGGGISSHRRQYGDQGRQASQPGTERQDRPGAD